MIRDIFYFLWFRDSDHACNVIIWVSGYLTQSRKRECRDYLNSLHEACEPRGIS